MVIAFAHRGARSERPENTLAAFRRARELGANGLESDAWLAADGEVVLVHDASFRRGVRKIRVAEHSAEELAAYGVPRLRDVYEECGTDFDFSIDAKQPEVIGPMADVARSVGGGAPGRLWVCSPDFELLRDRRDELADVRLVHSPGFRGVAPAAFERHAADLAAAGIDALNLHHSDWTLGTVTLVHRFAVKALAWDAQEMRHLLTALRRGVDGVFSDRVDRMLAAIGEWSAS